MWYFLHDLALLIKINSFFFKEEYESGVSNPPSPVRTQPQSSDSRPAMAMPPPDSNATEMTGLKSGVTYMTDHGATLQSQ